MLFFWNFLLRVGFERNGKIIFVFLISRSIPTYYGLKWSHNGIFKFLEFFFYFFRIFFYVSGSNEMERQFLFSVVFGIFQLILDWNEATMDFFNFLKFFPIFLEFSITRQVGTEHDDSFYFLPFSAFPPLFWLAMKP